MLPGEADVRTRERVRVRVPTNRKRSKRRGALAAVAGLFGVVAIALVLDGVWAGTTTDRELVAARDRLDTGADALFDGRTDDAAASFRLATESAERAELALSHPAVVVVSALPMLRDDVDAMRTLAGAGATVGRAATRLADAARTSGWKGDALPGLNSPAAVDTDVVRSLEPDLRTAADLFDDARASLADVRTGGLTEPVREAVVMARTTVSARGETVDRVADVAALLPELLGDPEPRTYVVLMQNLSDARGSGGHPGTYAVLRADHGAISLTGVDELGAVPDVRPVDAPPDVAARYADFGSLEHLVAATYPPDFRTSARLLLAMWAETRLPPVDGVVAVDSRWMAAVLDALGPIQTPAWPDALTAENVSEVFDRRTFELPDAESDRLQAALAQSLFDAILRAEAPGQPFAEAMASAARERHLQVYSTDPDEEELLLELGAAGAVEPERNALMVVWDGASPSRAGYFASKRVRYDATLDADGTAHVEVRMLLRNEAPTGPPSTLLGDGRGEPVGAYTAWANVYVPPGATGIRTRGSSPSSLHPVERELGRRVVMALLSTPPGGRDSVTVRYTLPEAAEREGDGWRWRLQVLPQPALRPDAVDVSVRAPKGADVLSHEPGADASRDAFAWSGFYTTPASLWIRYDTRDDR